MHCVANYEIRSAVSVVADDLVLTINDPGGAFKARIKNIPRSEFTRPFLLSLHIYFEAPDLEEAKEVAEKLMANCLNMLAFTTGSGFRKHRIRQIVDAETSTKKGMRDVLMWGEKVEYDDPQPFLREEISSSIERLLEHDVPPAIMRALRWYRLGIDAASPDDQFTYFWFALEIVAEFQKPTEKVHDKCPHCQSQLFCEQCEKHPVHRPYAKQAIQALMKAADQECDDATVGLLNKTRNSLMHGVTLREIESKLPDPHEHVVDILGRILWKALVTQFPKEMFNETLVMGMPSTFVHYKANAVAHVQTVVPIDQEGHFYLDFKGMTVEMKPSGPPQSASPCVIRMTHEQYDRLCKLSYQKGDHQEMLKRISGRVQEKEGHIFALVLATDMLLVRQAVETKQEGEWQALFRVLLEPTDGNDT
jgi:methylamine utilization protein MauJ